MMPDVEPCCGICGRRKEDVAKLIIGLRGAACNDCIILATELFEETGEGDATIFAAQTEDVGHCLLCGRTTSDGQRLASGQKGSICQDCIGLCSDILNTDEEAGEPALLSQPAQESAAGSKNHEAPETAANLNACGLCGKTEKEVKRLVTGLRTAVCTDCIELCNDILGLTTTSRSDEPEPLVNKTRADVCWANQMLPKTGLVTMHCGNASALDPEKGIVYIKPSGYDYDTMTPEVMVPVSLQTGEVMDYRYRPSVDLPHHLYIYRNMPDVRAVIHTHSNYATAFAAAGMPIPVALTAIADEFGGEIPCAPYIDNEGDHIGEAILQYMGRGPAILLGNHGVFAWGASVKEALKAAVMVEDVARTVLLAMQLGSVNPIPPEEAEKWFDRYQNRYGQG